MNSIIECISLSKYFNGKNKQTKAVDNISLEIKENEFVLIKGRSGAGKSTLINLMCGLDRPTSGSIIIEGNRIEKMSNNELSDLLSKRIGIIFQNFNLLPTYTIYENIEIALGSDPVKRKENNDIIRSTLKQLGLIERSGSFPTQLSIGEQQKVAVARTLAKNPYIIFADEPTGSVDDQTASEIIQHLLTMKKENKVTLIMATHGNTLDSYADRILIMHEGKLI